MNSSLTPENAATIFVRRIFNNSFLGAIRAIASLLEDGPIGRKKQSDDIDLHEWYKSLDDVDRTRIMKLVRKTAEISAFSALVILDNAVAGAVLEGEISDFALYIQTYKDHSSQAQNEFLTALRINSPNNTLGLHDRFSELINS